MFDPLCCEYQFFFFFNLGDDIFKVLFSKTNQFHVRYGLN